MHLNMDAGYQRSLKQSSCFTVLNGNACLLIKLFTLAGIKLIFLVRDKIIPLSTVVQNVTVVAVCNNAEK